jgi:hypothetical protein
MEERFDLVWLQRLNGATEVLRRDIPASEAADVLAEADRKDFGPFTTVFLRPQSAVVEETTETTETEATIEIDARLAEKVVAATLERAADAMSPRGTARTTIPLDWAVVSLMGHTSLGCRVRECELAGLTLFQLTIPREGKPDFVTYINPATALFGITPVAEEIARAYTRDHQPYDPAQHYRTPDPRTAVVDEDFAEDDERPDWADEEGL